METLAIILWITMIIVNAAIADNKGYNPLLFGIISVINWPIPLIIILFLEDKNK